MYDFYCDKCGHEFDLAENIKDFSSYSYIECPMCRNCFELPEDEETHNNS